MIVKKKLLFYYLSSVLLPLYNSLNKMKHIGLMSFSNNIETFLPNYAQNRFSMTVDSPDKLVLGFIDIHNKSSK